MFFRNLTFFRFPLSLVITSAMLDRELAANELKPVGALELSSRGWVPNSETAEGEGRFAFWSEGSDKVWLSLGGEDRMLPAAVLNAELAKRLKAIEEKEGRKPGGKARKRIKDDLVHELLPRAFVRPSRLDGYLDLTRGLVVVDTASRKAAEGFVSQLRHTLGSFPAVPLNAGVAPANMLTSWIDMEPELCFVPEGFSIGDEAVLKDPADKGAVVRVTRQELRSDEVSKHLEAGKLVTRLGLYFGEHDQNDHVSFTLDEDLVLRKFKLLDGAVDSLESMERDDLAAELMVRFELLTREVGLLFDALEPALKLSKVEA